jgi:hypothetical protein
MFLQTVGSHKLVRLPDHSMSGHHCENIKTLNVIIISFSFAHTHTHTHTSQFPSDSAVFEFVLNIACPLIA